MAAAGEITVTKTLRTAARSPEHHARTLSPGVTDRRWRCRTDTRRRANLQAGVAWPAASVEPKPTRATDRRRADTTPHHGTAPPRLDVAMLFSLSHLALSVMDSGA